MINRFEEHHNNIRATFDLLGRRNSLFEKLSLENKVDPHGDECVLCKNFNVYIFFNLGSVCWVDVLKEQWKHRVDFHVFQNVLEVLIELHRSDVSREKSAVKDVYFNEFTCFETIVGSYISYL
jgi:hypothetical protein